MVLVNTLVVDLSGQTVTLTVTSAGSPVETITYTFSSNTLQFASRSLINISGTDFLTLMQQINLFQTAIIFNFNVNVITSTPFTEVQNIEDNITGTNQWEFYSVTGYSPTGRTLDYTALGSNATVNLNNRQFAVTVNFPEWTLMLQALNHFKGSVQQFLNI
jgi:hypothetical protein